MQVFFKTFLSYFCVFSREQIQYFQGFVGFSNIPVYCIIIFQAWLFIFAPLLGGAAGAYLFKMFNCECKKEEKKEEKDQELVDLNTKE